MLIFKKNVVLYTEIIFLRYVVIEVLEMTKIQVKPVKFVVSTDAQPP